MKRTFIYTFLLGASLSLLSCGKDFLNITQIDKLTGNNYWTSKGDVEQYMGGIYSTFREATMTNIFFLHQAICVVHLLIEQVQLQEPDGIISHC
ncbi:RagB/SusD family nutrient uptake outer membrane protein [Sphingobacterium sp. E70]|uniref:RagB/SusD family nutrient uptake outer membrane protein n=1 Tax=Sphingobacterium sp. E70 TaxID=2853439 RepID=UPI00211D1169|nr:RagB/SusD family nutrient uptake outer membrane protein [Sphingobacterium sp. E70]ULT28096.1 RagB/SusD family nutrient uptake outer membrane protein [Sphingobacterium sp. E70]